ncbi:MAG: hypothetical protein L6R40_008594 [Gallowayella cf. fulva]|nr:MAG: hypothetical protein L6R40_008594 [Xanthomendoza cf. fulva]
MTLRPRDWLFNSINFSKLKADTLDTAKADVLYLLDCKYEISTPIGPGKELIAAVHKKSSVPPTGAAMRSFTAAITQELNDAVDAAPKYLTTAQLYAKLQVEHVAKGHLRFSPMHANIVTNMVTGAQARPSILLAPLPTKAPLSIEPSLIGCGFWDLRVILSVHLPDNAPGVCAGLKEWLSKDRPLSIGLGGLSFSLGPASTNSLVFTMSVTAYYVLKGNPAFRRVGYTSCPLWHIVPPWPHEPRADVYESLQGSPGHPYSLALPPQ